VRIEIKSPGVALAVIAVFALVGVGTWALNTFLGGGALPFDTDLDLDPSNIRIPVLLGAAGATALWLVVVGITRAVRQPRQPRPGPATQDLGEESPALAGMLVDDFEPSRHGVPATLLDLAARRAVGIEEIGPDRYQVRLAERRVAGLAPHEARVMELLRRKAARGVIPSAALTTGQRDLSRRWWKAFRGEVIDAAQARGLSRDLWDGKVISALAVAGLAPAPLWWAAFGAWQAALAYGMGALFVLGAAQGGRRQRDTEAGLAAAARWMGVQRFLRQGAFQDLPPDAVIVWERHLAYAAAFGIAPVAVRAFPMGADDDRLAWSAHSGEWRPVRIRYPRRWPPGWGARPALALLASLGVLAATALLIRVAFAVGLPPFDPGSPGTGTLVAAGFAAGWALIALAGAAGLMLLVRAVGDLGPAREVTGPVLRARGFGGGENSPPRYYVALDDGRSATIRAWRYRPQVARGGLIEGRMARATVTPHLRCVRSLQMVDA
jgi:hypothetical protein